MSIHQTIKDQIKDALRQKDTIRLDTLRGLSALFQNEIIMGKAKPEADGTLGDEAALAIIKRSTKQRKDSIEQFTKGGREDLAAKEKAELAILESYLPAMMPYAEVVVVVKLRVEKMKADGALDPKAAGKLVGMIMKELAGKAEGADVKKAVEEAIN